MTALSQALMQILAGGQAGQTGQANAAAKGAGQTGIFGLLLSATQGAPANGQTPNALSGAMNKNGAVQGAGIQAIAPGTAQTAKAMGAHPFLAGKSQGAPGLAALLQPGSKGGVTNAEESHALPAFANIAALSPEQRMLNADQVQALADLGISVPTGPLSLADIKTLLSEAQLLPGADQGGNLHSPTSVSGPNASGATAVSSPPTALPDGPQSKAAGNAALAETAIGAPPNRNADGSSLAGGKKGGNASAQAISSGTAEPAATSKPADGNPAGQAQGPQDHDAAPTAPVSAASQTDTAGLPSAENGSSVSGTTARHGETAIMSGKPAPVSAAAPPQPSPTSQTSAASMPDAASQTTHRTQPAPAHESPAAQGGTQPAQAAQAQAAVKQALAQGETGKTGLEESVLSTDKKSKDGAPASPAAQPKANRTENPSSSESIRTGSETPSSATVMKAASAAGRETFAQNLEAANVAKAVAAQAAAPEPGGAQQTASATPDEPSLLSERPHPENAPLRLTTAPRGDSPATPPRLTPDAMGALALQMRRHFDAGSSRFEIRLDPAELGRLDIRMEINAEGRVQATVISERPETHELLRQDARALERALNEAGLKTDSNSLNLSLRGDGQDRSGTRGDGQPARQNGYDGTAATDSEIDEEATAALKAQTGLNLSARTGVDIHI